MIRHAAEPIKNRQPILGICDRYRLRGAPEWQQTFEEKDEGVPMLTSTERNKITQVLLRWAGIT